MEFQAVMGDISRVSTDAVVLPANRMLREGSGASRAIFAKAGKTLVRGGFGKYKMV